MVRAAYCRYIAYPIPKARTDILVLDAGSQHGRVHAASRSEPKQAISQFSQTLVYGHGRRRSAAASVRVVEGGDFWNLMSLVCNPLPPPTPTPLPAVTCPLDYAALDTLHRALSVIQRHRSKAHVFDMMRCTREVFGTSPIRVRQHSIKRTYPTKTTFSRFVLTFGRERTLSDSFRSVQVFEVGDRSGLVNFWNSVMLADVPLGIVYCTSCYP